MPKFMLVAGTHIDQTTKQEYTVEKGSQPIPVDSADPLDKLFPGKFVRAANVDRGREAIKKAQAEQANDPGQSALGLREGNFVSPEAAEVVAAAKAGEEVRKEEALEAGEDPEAIDEEDDQEEARATRRGKATKPAAKKAIRKRKTH